MIIAIDFDGTLVKHDYPNIGKEVPHAFRILRTLIEQKHKLILYTMRSGKELEAAVNYCKDRGIKFWGINNNPEQTIWSLSPKVYAHIYIDDAALGCPLVTAAESMQIEERPWVNWAKVELELYSNEVIPITTKVTTDTVLYTSNKWQEIYPDIEVLDPDGWDRLNYEKSWFEEAISLQEYKARVSISTCKYNKTFEEVFPNVIDL